MYLERREDRATLIKDKQRKHTCVESSTTGIVQEFWSGITEFILILNRKAERHPLTFNLFFFLASSLFGAIRDFLVSVLKIDAWIIGLKIGSNRRCFLFPTGYSGKVTLHFIEPSKLSYHPLYFPFNGRTSTAGLKRCDPIVY